MASCVSSRAEGGPPFGARTFVRVWTSKRAKRLCSYGPTSSDLCRSTCDSKIVFAPTSPNRTTYSCTEPRESYKMMGEAGSRESASSQHRCCS